MVAAVTRDVHVSRPTKLFQTDVNYSYQVDRTVRRTKVEQRLQSDIYYNYNVTKVAADPAYTLGNPDFYNKGRIGLYRDGTLISTLQLLPTPVAHAYNLLSVTPGPNGSYFPNNPGAHGNSHLSLLGGGSGSGSSDGVIETLSIDTDSASVNLGKITAYRSGGIAITTPQATTDIHYTKTEVDALIATINDFITILNASIGANANYAQGLNSRLTAVEASMPTFKFNGGASQPLLQLQVKSGDFPGTAYYNTHGILKIATSTPPDANPY